MEERWGVSGDRGEAEKL